MSLKVTSHVGRDLLQSAEHFRTDKQVVWEYVANGLQYSSPGEPPRIVVTIDDRQKRIRIIDNGRGMDMSDLEHFFRMHGENRERAAGKIGRGMFGTGKSAAFAIGNSLRVTSVKNGKRTSVELLRSEIEGMKSGQDIPVAVVDEERSTGEPNGTTIEMGDIHLKRIDRAGIIKYIERHLSRYPGDVEVAVDHHLCEFKEPETAEDFTFTPSGEENLALGGALLKIRISKAPLDEEMRGIQVFSHGNWHTTTLAGAEGKPMSEFIFGEINVPAIEEYSGPIRPFDNTRSGQLNPANEIVGALYRFLGPTIERIRKELAAREREKAKTDEAKRLAKHAAKIAEVLSQDFASFTRKIARVHSLVAGVDSGTKSKGMSPSEEGPWGEGGENLASVALTTKQRRADGSKRDSAPPNFEKPVIPDQAGSTTGSPRSDAGKSRTGSGGFSVEHKNAGSDAARGTYVADRRTIVVNLDHPQIAAAYRVGGVEDVTFLRLTAEVALTEYSVALAQEAIEHYSEPDEALYDIREHIDRMSRRFSFMYSA